MVVLQLVMTRSRLGRALRAVADNPSLAAVRGIDRDRVVRASWMIAGALTAIAGVLIGLDRAIDPLIGWNYLIPVFAAAILGGLGSPAGAVVGALAIGVVEELSTLILPPSYRLGVSFVVIAMMLVVRPNGLFGQLQVRK
jgi:branched-chain amino acid transport system permease protein